MPAILFGFLIILAFVVHPLVGVAALMIVAGVGGVGLWFATMLLFSRPFEARRVARNFEEYHRKNGSRLNKQGQAEWWDNAEQKWKPYDA